MSDAICNRIFFQRLEISAPSQQLQSLRNGSIGQEKQ
jgi:hypothetical protein